MALQVRSTHVLVCVSSLRQRVCPTSSDLVIMASSHQVMPLNTDTRSVKDQKPPISDKEKKELLQRQAIIKSLIQRICTPVTAQKRLTSIQGFFKTYFETKPIHFTEKECLQIWKGLFYAIWYSEMDKGCDKIIETIVEAASLNSNLLISGFVTLKNEWNGIDAIRLDKFAYFVRRMVSRLILIEITEKREGALLEKILQEIQDRIGLVLQVCSIFIEEAFKLIVTEDRKPSSSVLLLLTLLKPFISLLTTSNDDRICDSVSKEVILEAMVEMSSPDNSFNEKDVFKFYTYLVKLIETFKETVEDKRRHKFINKTIKRINDSDEVETLLAARNIEANPQEFKKAIKKLRVKD